MSDTEPVSPSLVRPKIHEMVHPMRFFQRLTPIVGASALVLTGLTGTLLLAQSTRSTKLFARDALPPQFQQVAAALGERVWKPGNERVVQIGILAKGKQQKVVRITHELPNLLRFEEAEAGSRAVVFDGSSTKATDQLTDDDQDTAESLGEDSAESILYNLQNGYSPRFLGGRFRTDPDAGANYRGPWFDIFEIAGAAKTRATKDLRQKHVVLDSETQQLLYVRYLALRGGQKVLVQTEWSGWRLLNGNAIPTRVARRENGVEVWSFTESQVTMGPSKSDNAFGNQ